MILIIAIDVICVAHSTDSLLEKLYRKLTFSAPKASDDLFCALSILAFLLVAEIWQWFMRLKMALSLFIHKLLKERYDLDPKEDAIHKSETLSDLALSTIQRGSDLLQ
jgi:hypothetical protein